MTHGATQPIDFHDPARPALIWLAFRTIVRSGHLKIRDWRDEIHEFGDKTGKAVAVHFRDARIERALVLDPLLALAEGYMDGEIELEAGSTIYDLLSLLARNIGRGDLPGWLRLAGGFRRITRLLRQINDPVRSRRNVHHHYDLPGSLYDLFLDADKQYSCAYFATGTETLEEAQLAKKRHIARKLCLSPGQSVLDIGCGWGGLSLHLAREEGTKVVGITLSEEQERYATARARALGERNASFRLCDYRAVCERFDRIVSVGMFEHVGVPNYGAFFRKMSECLKDNGVALLHTIGRLSGPGATNPFIAKYIFPGGYTPALSEIVPHIEKSGLIITDIEVLRLHYAATLAAWRRNFEGAWGKAAGMLSERFCRMWQYYLASCEVGFRYHDLAVFQIQLTKEIGAAPFTRDYLYVQRQDAAQTPEHPF